MVAHRWPEGTVYRRIVLEPDAEERPCRVCRRPMRICDHRHRRLFTLAGPLQLTCKLLHCADRACPGAGRTTSPRAELDVALPRWLVDWEVFAWIGQQRAARRRTVAQLRSTLAGAFDILLSDDAIEDYLAIYDAMLVADAADHGAIASACEDVSSLSLSLDVLYGDQGLDALAVVRERRTRRVWFAAQVAAGDESGVRALLTRARERAAAVGRPVESWTVPSHEALGASVAAVFPEVPRRACVPPVARARRVSWRPPSPSRPPSPRPSRPPHSAASSSWRPVPARPSAPPGPVA